MQRLNVDVIKFDDFEHYTLHPPNCRLSASWYPSEEDGTLMLKVQTRLEEDEELKFPNGPKIRLYLNDEVVFENPPYPVEN
jgi:hypothetical protein